MLLRALGSPLGNAGQMYHCEALYIVDAILAAEQLGPEAHVSCRGQWREGGCLL